MEQFSLEKYLANPSRRVVTRDDRSARIICTDMKSTTYPVVALVEKCSGGYEELITFSKNGEYAVNDLSRSDLFFAPEKHEGWINVYRNNGNHTYAGAVYDSQEDAKKRKAFDENYVTTIKIEWEE